MPPQPNLRIRQRAAGQGQHATRLTYAGRACLAASAGLVEENTA